MMTPAQIKEKAYQMYNDSWMGRLIFLDKSPKLLRHEDRALNGSGYWVECSVFVPDDEE